MIDKSLQLREFAKRQQFTLMMPGFETRPAELIWSYH